MVRKLMLAAAASALVATPVVAAPVNPAASLSLAKSARASASVGATNKLEAGGYIGIAIAVAAVALGVIIIADDNNDDDSDSN